MGTKEFRGDCVGNPFGRLARLVEVIDNAREITKLTLFKHCAVAPLVRLDMGRYPNDYTFHKHKNIYFYCWSAIEHFYW